MKFGFDVSKRFLRWILPVIAAIIALPPLAIRAWYLLQPAAYYVDAPVYWAMGRSMLNGLTPYIDLFEIKPPGMFFLSAASFLIFESPYLGNIIGAAAVLLAPVCLVAWSLRRTAGTSRERQLVGAISSLLGGTIVSVYLSIHGLPWQTELFGAAFGIVYVFLAHRISHAPHARLYYMTLAGLALLASAGFKEPFVLTCLAGALFIDARPRILLRTFVIPLGVALVAGTFGAAAFGMLIPYVTKYLPLIIVDRVAGSDTLLLIRGLQIHRIAKALNSLTPWLAVSIVIWMGLTAQGMWRDGASNRRHRAWNIAAFAGAVYLLIFSVGLGGVFNTHHFAFAVPAYWALLMRSLDVLQEKSKKPFRILSSAFIGAAALALLTLPAYRGISAHDSYGPETLQEELRIAKAADKRTRMTATSIDATLTACEKKRYLVIASLSTEKVYGWTSFSPLNHYIFADLAEESLFDPSFEHIARERLHEADLLVTHEKKPLPSTPFTQEVSAYVRENFTTEPWPCAPASSIPKGYRLFYRIYEQGASPKSAILHERMFLDYDLSEFENMNTDQVEEVRNAAMRELGFKNEAPFHIGVTWKEGAWHVLLIEPDTYALRGYLVVSTTEPPTILRKETPKDVYFEGSLNLR